MVLINFLFIYDNFSIFVKYSINYINKQKDIMNKTFFTFSIIISLLISNISISAQDQEKPKTPEEAAIEQTTKFRENYCLLSYQTFLVDSILRHDFVALHDEMTKMQKSGMVEMDTYKVVQKKWANQVDSALVKVFNSDQWYSYLRSKGKVKRDKSRDKKIKKERKIWMKEHKDD